MEPADDKQYFSGGESNEIQQKITAI